MLEREYVMELSFIRQDVRAALRSARRGAWFMAAVAVGRVSGRSWAFLGTPWFEQVRDLSTRLFKRVNDYYSNRERG